MPVFRFDRVFGIACDVKAFLNRDTRGAAPDAEHHGEQAEYRQKFKSKRQELRQKRQELRQVNKDEKDELRAKKQHAEMIEQMKQRKRKKQEIFQLEMDLRGTEGRPDGEPETGALPDFAVIGGAKCGTTFFYHLLTLHPQVEPAAMKETHYFDILIEDEGTEWYRRCFPPPRWKDGRRTITGEATPYYFGYPPAAERMAEVIPQARLIVLLRNPVDRAYSFHHHLAKRGLETRTFEEAIEEAIELEKTLPLGEEDETSEHDEDRAGLASISRAYLTMGIYVDQLLHWSKFFGDEQMLVLKSEDFFERPAETLKPVLDFLGLPDWELAASEIVPKKRNEGHYEQGMEPVIRRRLEAFFEPHNRRLYEYLGANLGW